MQIQQVKENNYGTKYLIEWVKDGKIEQVDLCFFLRFVALNYVVPLLLLFLPHPFSLLPFPSLSNPSLPSLPSLLLPFLHHRRGFSFRPWTCRSCGRRTLPRSRRSPLQVQLPDIASAADPAAGGEGGEGTAGRGAAAGAARASSTAGGAERQEEAGRSKEVKK